MPPDVNDLLPLKPFVFQVLIELVDQPQHGWSLLRALENRTGARVLPGQLYRQLDALLDVLAREKVRATFFLIDREITDRTVPLVARMFADGHSVALHSDSRFDLLMSPAAFARKLTTNADRIERLTGHRPIRAFRPHAGWRSATMYAGLKRIDYRLIGWSWMRWDWNWYRTRTADATVPRVISRIQPGDIVVMHDGNVYNPGEDQRHTVDATARLIPLLRAKGYVFGKL